MINEMKQELRQSPVVLVGISDHARDMQEFAERAGETEDTILLQGESGTGKDHLAEIIHQYGRQDSSFVPVDCGALSETLSEAELFGHIRGAFTDAHENKPGLVEIAEGGTLFFNEVANMSIGLQAKFLRILEKRSFRAVGGTREMSVNTRFVVATNVDLKELVSKGKFRMDLYHRINVVTFVVPPLRERVEDVPLLAEYFLSKEKGLPKSFTLDALVAMTCYHWPGNVRELRNTVARARFLSGKKVNIEPEDVQPYSKGVGSKENCDGKLPATTGLDRESVIEILKKNKDNGSNSNEVEGGKKPDNNRESSAVQEDLVLPTLDENEENYLRKVIKKTGGDIRKSANIAGIDYQKMYRRIYKYNLTHLMKDMRLISSSKV